MSWKTQRQLSFIGGENRKIIPTLTADDQLVNATNCVMSADGVIETRYGKVKVNADSLGTGAATSVHLYTQADGDNYFLVQWTTILYKATWDGSATLSAGDLTEIKTGLNAAKLRSVVWKDVIILTNGVDAPFKYDGSTCTNLAGSPPDSNLIAVYAGRLFLVDAANVNSVRYSELEDYGTWPALNIILVRDDDGDFITGLAPQSGGLVIGKTSGMFTLYGTSNATFRLSDSFSTVGPIGYDAMLPAGIFMGRDNWYAFSLGEVKAMPDTHTTLLEAATAAEKSAVVGCTQSSKSRHYFALGSNVIVFDAKYSAVTTWTGLNVKSLCATDAEGFDGDLLIGDATVGRVYKLTGGDDDGTAISTTVKTGYYDYGTEQDKEWRYFWPDVDMIGAADTTTYRYSYDVDFERLYGSVTRVVTALDTLTWDVDAWGADWADAETYTRDSSPFWLHNVRGRYISHELFSDARIRFKGFSAKWHLVGRI